MRRSPTVTGLLGALAAVACGVLAFADFISPSPAIRAVGAVLVEGVVMLGAFALLLGVLNLLATHARRVASDDKGRGASLLLIVALLGTTVVGVGWPNSVGLRWIFSHIYHPLQSTMAALLAFFLMSAAYRTFRLRNGAAWILMGSSLILILTQLPFAGALSAYLPMVRDWLMAVPVTAAMRGIILGIALGTIATALRVLLAIDRPYAGE
ncbi:MAG: hypothetical protein V1772_04925 [Chloroflexota bacterium]